MSLPHRPEPELRPRHARHASRRSALRGLIALSGLALVTGAIATSVLPGAADPDDDDDSGRGRGRGRGRGGRDDDRGAADDREESAPVAQAPADSIEIRIVGDDAGDFVPGELTVDLGQSVTFVNLHSDEHTATGSAFDTGIIAEGSLATITLDRPGEFAYACQIHPEMTGRISVRDETGVVPQATPIATPVGADTVRIANLAYDPAELSVAAGATVVWTNDDAVPHTVTAADGEFDSGIFDPGSSFSFTFDQPGEFSYQCLLHPQMQGRIIVS